MIFCKKRIRICNVDPMNMPVGAICKLNKSILFLNNKDYDKHIKIKKGKVGVLHDIAMDINNAANLTYNIKQAIAQQCQWAIVFSDQSFIAYKNATDICRRVSNGDIKIYKNK